MEIRFVLSTVFEIAIVGFIIYGLFFEDRIAEAERKVFAIVKEKVRSVVSAHSHHFVSSK